jgi:putative phosphoesterase
LPGAGEPADNRWMRYVMYGPAPWERAVPRYGPVQKVAVISDVHTNVTALMEVLADIEAESVDLVVSCGDLTWGSQPADTIRLMRGLGGKALFVRGNGERAVLEIAAGERQAQTPREAWVPAQHSAESVTFVAAIPFSIVVEIIGLGPVRFCHGSPRSDTEVVTPVTPAERISELAAGIDEDVLVTGHTHMQFDRRVNGLRSVNPGSVGLPYHEGQPGVAYWALLGPDVSLRQTEYDVTTAADVGVGLGDPSAAKIAETLLTPPTPAEICEHAERLIFSD